MLSPSRISKPSAPIVVDTIGLPYAAASMILNAATLTRLKRGSPRAHSHTSRRNQNRTKKKQSRRSRPHWRPMTALAERLKLPIRYVGVGESAEDLQAFEATTTFVSALLDGFGTTPELEP